jgi:hypothetical protein
VTLIEVTIAAMTLLTAIAGATLGWERWQFVGALCGFVVGLPVGLALTFVTVLCSAALLLGLEAIHAFEKLPRRIQDAGIMAVMASATMAGIAGLGIAAAPGGVCGIFLGWLAAASAVSLALCSWIWISVGLMRITSKGNRLNGRQPASEDYNSRPKGEGTARLDPQSAAGSSRLWASRPRSWLGICQTTISCAPRKPSHAVNTWVASPRT